MWRGSIVDYASNAKSQRTVAKLVKSLIGLMARVHLPLARFILLYVNSLPPNTPQWLQSLNESDKKALLIESFHHYPLNCLILADEVAMVLARANPSVILSYPRTHTYQFFFWLCLLHIRDWPVVQNAPSIYQWARFYINILCYGVHLADCYCMCNTNGLSMMAMGAALCQGHSQPQDWIGEQAIFGGAIINTPWLARRRDCKVARHDECIAFMPTKEPAKCTRLRLNFNVFAHPSLSAQKCLLLTVSNYSMSLPKRCCCSWYSLLGGSPSHGSYWLSHGNDNAWAGTLAQCRHW